MAYQHTNKKGTDYFLHYQDVILRGSGKKQRIYFFRREVTKNALDALPEGFTVAENTKTGLPTLRRK